MLTHRAADEVMLAAIIVDYGKWNGEGTVHPMLVHHP